MTDRLYRSRDDRIFAGVAGGLADRLAVDPSLVRLAWALLVIFTGGLALIVYIVAAFVIPEEPELASAGPSTGREAQARRRAANRQWGEGAAVIVGAFLVILGGYFLLREWLPQLDFDWFWPLMPGSAPGVLLLVLVMRSATRRPGVGQANPARRGSLIAVTWLIGLGVSSWSARRPACRGRRPGRCSSSSAASPPSCRPPFAGDPELPVSGRSPGRWPGLGVRCPLLLSTTGNLGARPREIIDQWWPVAVLRLGVWFSSVPSSPGEGLPKRLPSPIGGATEANIRIQFGAGELTTHTAASGNLVDGEFAGGVSHRIEGSGRLELRQDTTNGLPWFDRRSARNAD